MKEFHSIPFSQARCRQDLEAFRTLLAGNSILEENHDLKPFFEAHHDLSVLLGSYFCEMSQFDLLAFQYQLFGDFSCDLVVGDSQNKAYGFVELEEAGPTSIFHRQGRKATPEWSKSYENGISQIIDWFWKLDDMSNTDDFESRFGRRRAPYFGLLVIGRSSYLTSLREKQRWEWRRRKVVVNSQQIVHVTYDELHANLTARLDGWYPPAELQT